MGVGGQIAVVWQSRAIGIADVVDVDGDGGGMECPTTLKSKNKYRPQTIL